MSEPAGTVPPVSVEQLTIERGRRTTLHDVTLTLPPRSLAVVLGPNGAGKSTLIRALLGELKPASGSVRVLGEDLSRLSWTASARLRRRIGLMPQLPDHPSGATLSVREVVEIGRVCRNPFGRLTVEDRAICQDWLERFGLARIAARNFLTLSGGEQRKAHLARLFAQEADLVLLDEPAGHLDLPSQDALLSRIVDFWQETHRTVVMVTHELRHIPAEATHVCMLREGSLVAFGPPEAILSSERITELYGERLELVRHRGRYLAVGARLAREDRHG